MTSPSRCDCCGRFKRTDQLYTYPVGDGDDADWVSDCKDCAPKFEVERQDEKKTHVVTCPECKSESVNDIASEHFDECDYVLVTIVCCDCSYMWREKWY